MTGTLDDDALRQLRTLWDLAPPGIPVRQLTGPLADCVVGAVGPEAASASVARVLGDVEATYRATLVLKLLAGEVDVLLHAVGLVAALEHVLEPDERVISVSLDHDGGGTAGVDGLGVGDLVTDRQIAEFTFIKWATTGGNSQREVKLLRDLIKLELLEDEAAAGRRRVLYVTGGGPALKFLRSGQTIAKKLGRNADVLDRLVSRHGTRFRTVGEYWRHARTDGGVEVVDLHEVAPAMRPPT